MNPPKFPHVFKCCVLIYSQQMKHVKSTQINDKARESEKEKAGGCKI